jgi:hypothetical protein
LLSFWLFVFNRTQFKLDTFNYVLLIHEKDFTWTECHFVYKNFEKC